MDISTQAVAPDRRRRSSSHDEASLKKEQQKKAWSFQNFMYGLCVCEGSALDNIIEDTRLDSSRAAEEIFMEAESCDYPYSDSPLYIDTTPECLYKAKPLVSVDTQSTAGLSDIFEEEEESSIRMDDSAREATPQKPTLDSRDDQGISLSIFDKDRKNTFRYGRSASPMHTPFDLPTDFLKDTDGSVATAATVSTATSQSFEEEDTPSENGLIQPCPSFIERSEHSKKSVKILLNDADTPVTKNQRGIFRQRDASKGMSSTSKDSLISESMSSGMTHIDEDGSDIDSIEEVLKTRFPRLVRMYPKHSLFKPEGGQEECKSDTFDLSEIDRVIAEYAQQ